MFKFINILIFIFLTLIFSCQKTANDVYIRKANISFECKKAFALISLEKETEKIVLSNKAISQKNKLIDKKEIVTEHPLRDTIEDLKAIRSYLIKKDAISQVDRKISELKVIVEKENREKTDKQQKKLSDQNKGAQNIVSNSIPQTKENFRTAVRPAKVSDGKNNYKISEKLTIKLKQIDKEVVYQKKPNLNQDELDDIDNLIDEVDGDADYAFADSTISGLSYDLDLAMRENLYGDKKELAHRVLKKKSTEKIIQKSVNNEKTLLEEPQIENEFNFIAREEKSTGENEKENILARLEEITVENFKNSQIVNGDNYDREVEEEQFDIIADRIKREIPELVLSKSEKLDRLISENNIILKPIISADDFKERLREDREDLRGAVSKNKDDIIAQKNKNNKFEKVILASAENVLSDSTRREKHGNGLQKKEISLSGNIIIPHTSHEYSNGYIELSTLNSLGKDGYPHDYPKNKTISLPIKGAKVVPFKISDFPSGKEQYLVAEIFPAEISTNYKEEDNKMFLGFPEKNPLLLTGDINDIKITFPKLVNREVTDSTGKIFIINNKMDGSENNKENFNSEVFVNNSAISSSLKNAEVAVLGTNIKTYTDENGVFSVPIKSNLSGTIYEILGRGFYPTVFSTCSSSDNNFPVYTLTKIDEYIDLLKQFKLEQLEDRGIILGKLISKDSVEGIDVDLSTIDTDGPFYFNKEGELDFNLEKTSSDGRFVYFNVTKGLKIIGPHIKKEELPGGVVNVFAETISHIEIDIDNRVELEGIVINAFKKENENRVKNAEVSIIGAPNEDTVMTDEKGYFKITSLRAINNLNTIEVSKEGFPVTRITTCLRSNGYIEIYIFPYDDFTSKKDIKEDGLRSLLEEHGFKQDPSKAMVMGSIMHGGELTINISDSDNSQIVYFDEAGNINLDRKKTAPIDGNFIILNVPPGQQNIMAYDSKGELRHYFTIRSSESIINSVFSY